VTRENGKLYCFLLYHRSNHVEAFCPNGHENNMFVTPEGFMQLIQMNLLPVMFGMKPSADFRRRTIATIGPDPLLDTEDEPGPGTPPKTVEIDVPHWMLRELYDQLRDYENND